MSIIVETAQRLRDTARLGSPSYSTSEIVAHSFPRVLVTGYDLPRGIDEATAAARGGTVILYRRGLSTAEQRFAIAHALAHLVFDDDAPCVRMRSGTPAQERRADTFAAELLAPLADVAKLLHHLPSRDPDEQRLYLDHVDVLASRFQVPSKVIRMRIRELVTSTH